MPTGSAPCARSAPCAGQEAERNTGTDFAAVAAERHRGREAYRQERAVQPVQLSESYGGFAEVNTGHDIPMPGPSIPLPEVLTEADTGRGEMPGIIPTQSDLGLSVGTTLEDNGPVLGRPRRYVKPLDRLVVGNPTGWHFNRAKPRR